MRKAILGLLALATSCGMTRQAFAGASIILPTGGAVANIGATPNRTLVSNRLHAPDQSVNNTSNFQTMNRLVYTSPTGASDLVLCFAGWHMGPAEFALAPANFTMAAVSIAAGGSGYALNDIIALPTVAFASTPAGTARAGRVRVIGVSSGVITAVAIEDPGIWSGPVASAQAQASTTGSGTGATFTVTAWNSFATHVRVAVEPVASNTQSTSGATAIRPVKFGGSQSAGTAGGTVNVSLTSSLDGEVPVGKMLCSDPVNVNIAPGGQFAVRTFTNGTGTGFSNILTNVGDASGFGSPSTSDNSQSGTINAQAASTSPSYGPALILGTPVSLKTTFAVLGTSIDWGTTGGTPATDLGDAYGDQGWPQRAIGPTNPLVSFASAGNQIAYLFNPSYGRQAEFDAITRAAAQDVLVDLGVNDMNPTLGNIDEATVLADEQQLSAELRGIRSVKKVFTATSTPYSIASNTAPNATCLRSGGTAWVGTNGIEIRNFLLRQGLIPWNGAAGDTYAPPATGLTLGSSAVSTGAQTVTPSAMSITSGGATFALAPGMRVLVNPGGADQETVTVTAANDTYNVAGYPTTIGTTFTATFANAHAANEPITIYSPYAHYPQFGPSGFDFVIDWGTTLESSIGSCEWVNIALTGDLLHPSYLTETTGGHATMAALAAPIIAANE